MKKTFFYWRCGMHGGLYVTKESDTTSLGVGGCDKRTEFDPGTQTQTDVEIPEEEALRLLLAGGGDTP